MSKSFDFKLIEQFLGYNSESDKTRLRPEFLVRGSKNVYKKLNGNIASRPGLKIRGTGDSSSAGVKASHEWITSLGDTKPLRVANNKLEIESEISGSKVWYELLMTSSLVSPAQTLTRFIFDTWWDNQNKKDRLLMVRGDDKILHWSGGMAEVDSVTDVVNGVVVSVSITVAGTGYAIGDTITVSTGNGDCTLYVEGIAASAVSSLKIIQGGTGYSNGAGQATTTSGSGTNCTVNLTVSNYTLKLATGETWASKGFAVAARYTDNLQREERRLTINGNEYSYFGVSADGNILQGVTPDPTAEPVGSIAIQSVLSFDDVPVDGFEADFLKTVNNQVLIGSYTSPVIYISADSEFSDFTNSGSYVYGDPDKIIMDSVGRGIGVKDGQIVLFGGDSDLYVVTPNTNVNTSYTDADGANRFMYQKIEKANLNGLRAAKGQEFISNFGNYLIWLDQANQLQALGSFANIDSVKPTNISLPVSTELSEDDFTDGHIKVIEDTVYITAPNNSRDWMYQEREVIDDTGQVVAERIWHPPQVRGIARFALIDGVTYGHSNVNPCIYQVWDTNQWYDDGPSNEQYEYGCRAKFAYQQHGRRNGLLTFDKIYTEGYTTDGVELNLKVYFDYQGASGYRDLIVNSQDNQAKFFEPLYTSLGDASIGDGQMGDGIIPEGNDQELLPKFRAINNIDQVNCYEYALEYYSTEIESRWEIIATGTNARIASASPIKIRK